MAADATTTLRSSAAAWSASPSPGAWRARAAASSCSTRATAPCAQRAATSRWSGCRARGSACPRTMPAGRSARRTPGRASPGALKEETGLDVCFQRPGGFHLALSERELEARANSLKRLHNQPGIVDYKTEILDRAQVASDAAGHRARGGRRQLLPARRPRELAAPVPRPAHRDQRARRRPTCRAIASRRIAQRRRRVPADDRAAARCAPPTVVLAAGNANMRAGADGRAARRRCGPSAARSSSPSGCAPFLRHPVVTLRQTDEGTVMIGESQGRAHRSGRPDARRQRRRGRARGAHVPAAGQASMWCARGARIRVMTQDGFPIYDQSREPSRRLRRRAAIPA